MTIQQLNKYCLPKEFQRLVIEDLVGIPDYEELKRLVANGDPNFLLYLEAGKKLENPAISLICQGLILWFKCEEEDWRMKCLPQHPEVVNG